MVQIRLGLCLMFSLYANWTDWKVYKIKNTAVSSFLTLGLIIQFIAGGIGGLISAIGGIAIMLMLFPFFALQMLGAGDIKALMAIGAMLGWPLAGWALVYSVVGAGVIALIVLLVRGNGRERLKYLWNYLKICFFSHSIQPYAHEIEADNSTFRFSFGITVGMVILLIQKILAQL